MRYPYVYTIGMIEFDTRYKNKVNVKNEKEKKYHHYKGDDK